MKTFLPIFGLKLVNNKINFMSKFTHSVKANAFNRETGSPVGQERWEGIDTKSNPLFKNCKTILDIKNAYESFWNDLNSKSEEIVFVLEVKIVK